MDFKKYNELYELKEFIVNNKIFKYRYFKNESAKQTVVLLVGGIGLSDLVYNHFTKFTKEFSVITFDYSINFKTNNELCFAINELLISLNEKVWFIGQSLGGFISLIMATNYPDVTKGLILSNTGCLSENLSSDALKSLTDMMDRTKKSKKLIKILPMNLFKKLIRKKITKKHAKEFNEEQKEILNDMFDIMDDQLQRNYQLHMSDLLIDLENHLNNKKESYKYLDDKAFLILSEDDKTFTQEVKDELYNLMYNPTLKTDLLGGHIALLIKCDEYVSIITEYIKRRID
ncbi:MAG: alpha/beta hydrolase [bacterium]